MSVIWKLSEGRLFHDRGVELIKEESSFEWDDQTLKRYSGLETQYWYGENFLSFGLLKIKDEEGATYIRHQQDIVWGEIIHF
ncbi:MAG: hypothetical protein IK005_07260 [Paludibacteraceae bacterium]|nr:hypothetical protein [Paludibacteraceae bacterium]